MPGDVLRRLIALCPPPPRPLGAGGDRAAARAASGWHVPDHVLEVIEVYGDGRWMDWLQLPSPFVEAGREALAQRNEDHPTLIGFSDPEEALLFTDDDGVVVLGATEEVRTKKTLAEVLLGWLSGQETFGLPTVAELTEGAELAPFVVPGWDEARATQRKVVVVSGGDARRAARWSAFSEALGARVPMGVVGAGEKQQDRVYVPDLEAELLFDSYRAPEQEKLHLAGYADRWTELDARIDAALAAAGMERAGRTPGAKPPEVRAEKPAPEPTKKPKGGEAKPAETKAPKKSAKAVVTDLRDALERAVLPEGGWGLGRAPRLGVSPKIDAFLGLGFPHLLTLTEDPLPDLETAMKVHGPGAPLASVVPRELPMRLHAARQAAPDAARMQAAYAAAPKIPLERAIREGLKSTLPVFALEAAFGSQPVAEALVAALVKAPLASWKEPLDRPGPPAIRALGWLLCRVPAAQRTELRAALEETFARVSASPAKGWRPHKALDVILHGRAGVERSGGRAASQPDGALFFADLAFVDDDREWLIDTVKKQLATLRPADRERFDPQLVVQGGAPLLAAFRASTDRFLKETRPAMEAMLALFA